MRSRCLLAALGVAAASSCDAVAPPSPPDPECAVDTASAALSAADRKIVGEPAPYPADGALRGRDAELASSIAERRAVAWEIVARVTEPVALAESAFEGKTIPRFQTWFDVDDLRRVFLHLYEPLSLEEKRARSPFAPEDVSDALTWNTTAVESLPNWPIERYLEHVAAIDTEQELHGVGGITRVAYSPGAVRHLLASYPDILACRDREAPPALSRGDATSVPVVELQLELDACATRSLGVHRVELGESLLIELDVAEGAPEIVARVDGRVRCRGSARCEVRGPADVEVGVESDAASSAGVVVRRFSPNPTWAACLASPFPLDAAIVKADYRRADFDLTMPAFDTSAAGLAARLSAPLPSWSVPDREVDPTPDSIFTLTLPTGERYRLAALHVMTKELDHWTWTSLFWSDAPNADLGEDRPSAVSGVWTNYKMCVATAFEEGDTELTSLQDYPSLAAAMKTVAELVPGRSWCSNPYLEEGHGNAATNCVGCHQYAGTGKVSEDVLRLEGFGSTMKRNNFPTDYSFAVVQGDALSTLFAETELYYLGAPAD
jgi:cytochrome c553